jgi:phosphoglycerate dehydrogenase-like enzyme
VDVLDHDRLWTCGKGVYAEPVAEHALALALAGLRAVGHYARQRTWSGPRGRNLLGGKVTILGGGEITRSLIRLLGPFGPSITVVRRHAEPLDGADEVVEASALHRALREADLVVLALALTPETEQIVDAAALQAMPDHAWLVNVARGRHVDTDALVAALEAGDIGGAALDVTDPEPLPDGHPLWHLDNCLLTPHVGNTPEMGRVLLAERVRENVRRYAAGEQLLGPVHVELGY